MKLLLGTLTSTSGFCSLDHRDLPRSPAGGTSATRARPRHAPPPAVPARHGDPLDRRRLADPRSGRALPLQRPHGPAPAVHVRGRADPDRRDAGLDAAADASPESREDGIQVPHPAMVAFILFNWVLLFMHWPAVVTASVHSEWLHFVLHVGRHALGTGRCGGRSCRRFPSCPPAGARPDDLSVPPVARADDPRLVPHVRHASAVSGLRDLPSDLGDRRDDRPADRGAAS